MNVVVDGRGEFVEVQGTAEQGAFSRVELDRLLDLALAGCEQLRAVQLEVMASPARD
jgi:ribonuclease PH